MIESGRSGRRSFACRDRSADPFAVAQSGSWFRATFWRKGSSGKEGSEMGDKGAKDKGKKEAQKKAQHTAKEKRKIKQEKKGKS
jgi:hypothetical protein